ncbi:MAG: hypothetical protein QMD78_02650 [Methanocellales archaeon]|nr:hypothetical protein [Methanocellales archaeon]
MAGPMGVEFKTKIEIAIDLIKSAVDSGISANTAAFDTWYFAKELIDAIEREWTGLQGQR